MGIVNQQMYNGWWCNLKIIGALVDRVYIDGLEVFINSGVLIQLYV